MSSFYNENQNKKMIVSDFLFAHAVTMFSISAIRKKKKGEYKAFQDCSRRLPFSNKDDEVRKIPSTSAAGHGIFLSVQRIVNDHPQNGWLAFSAIGRSGTARQCCSVRPVTGCKTPGLITNDQQGDEI